MSADVLKHIQRAVERAVEGPVKHRETVAVVETFRGQTVWQGAVEVFDVDAPPPAVAYGWLVDADPEPQYIAVLGKPPVDSALTAVRMWLVSQARK